MITYAFAQRIVPLIQAGVVTQTFRGPSRRHARPGESIRLTDRIAFSPIIPDPRCTGVARCEVVWRAGRIVTVRLDGMPMVRLDSFARNLGYADQADLEADFNRSYGADYFEGFLIEWAPPEAQMAEVG